MHGPRVWHLKINKQSQHCAQTCLCLHICIFDLTNVLALIIIFRDYTINKSKPSKLLDLMTL